MGKLLSFHITGSVMVFLVLNILLDISEGNRVTVEGEGKNRPLLNPVTNQMSLEMKKHVPPTPIFLLGRRKKRDIDYDDYEDDYRKCQPVPQRRRKPKESRAPPNLLDLLNDGSLHATEIQTGDIEDVVLILGNKGSGKTTIARILSNNLNGLVVGVSLTGQFTIFESGNGATESTSKPNPLLPDLIMVENPDTKNMTAFLDCPGFDGNRSQKEEIAVNYFMKEILKKVSHLKLIFLVTHNAVRSGNDSKDFDILVSNAVRILKNIPQYSNSIGLVVTKAESFDGVGEFMPDDLITNETVQFMHDYCDDLRSQLDSEANMTQTAKAEEKLPFVEALLNKNQNNLYGQTSLSRIPTECGRLTESEEIADAKNEITKLYSEELKYASADNVNFGYSLERNPWSSLTSFLSSLSEEVTKQLQLLMAEFNAWHDNQYINSTTDLIDKTLKLNKSAEKLEGLLISWGTLQDQSNLVEISGLLTSSFGDLGYNISSRHSDFFIKYQSYFSFMDVADEVKENHFVDEWKLPVEDTKRKLKEKEDETKMALRRRVLTINEEFASDISTLLGDFIEWLSHTKRHCLTLPTLPDTA